MSQLENAFARVERIQNLPEAPLFELRRASGIRTDGNQKSWWYVEFKWGGDFVVSRSTDTVEAINMACDVVERKLMNGTVVEA